jgi:arginine transport system substrate-binding protein
LKYSDTNDELYAWLKRKEIDIVIDDAPIAGAFIKESNACLKKDFFLEDSMAAYGIAFRKGNAPRKEKVNQEMRALKENGFMEQLTTKWFAGIELK